MSESEPLEKSLVRAIADSGGLELAADAAELSLDQLVADGLLRDVPIVGTLANLYKAGIGVRNYLFIRKVARFLGGLKDIPVEERERFVKETQGAGAQKLGETLLLLLDRMDELEKATLLARAMKHYVAGRIDFGTFRVFGAAIDRCFVADLALLRSYQNQRLTPDAAVRLSAAGLLRLLAVLPVGGPGPFNNWDLTPLGKQFAEFLVEDMSSDA